MDDMSLNKRMSFDVNITSTTKTGPVNKTLTVKNAKTFSSESKIGKILNCVSSHFGYVRMESASQPGTYFFVSRSNLKSSGLKSDDIDKLLNGKMSNTKEVADNVKTAKAEKKAIPASIISENEMSARKDIDYVADRITRVKHSDIFLNRCGATLNRILEFVSNPDNPQDERDRIFERLNNHKDVNDMKKACAYLIKPDNPLPRNCMNTAAQLQQNAKANDWVKDTEVGEYGKTLQANQPILKGFTS